MQKEYLWMLPHIGVILALIAFFTPAVFYGSSSEGSEYLWIYGLYSYKAYNIYEDSYWSDIRFVDNPDVLYPSIIFSIIIMFNILVLLGSSLNYRRRIKNRRIGKPNLGLISSILIITLAIAWIILMEISWESNPNFWDYWDPAFGLIGLFIGGGLGIIGFTAAKISQKREKGVITVPKTISAPTPQTKLYSILPINLFFILVVIFIYFFILFFFYFFGKNEPIFIFMPA